MNELVDISRPHAGMRELALFAGAGGGILGGHMLGWRTVCAVEWEPYAASVLASRQNDGLLPPFPIWDDVQTFDGRAWRGCVDVVSGGFPCQDISVAGKGAGIDGKRSGMWSDMARIVGEVRPRYVFVENSPALLIRGLGRVLGDLAALGYDCRWTVLGAADVGAPHQRDRFWLVARRSEDVSHAEHGGARWRQQQPEGIGEEGKLADSTDARVHQRRRPDDPGEDVRLMGGNECDGLQGIREEEGDVLADANSQSSTIRGHDHATAGTGGRGDSDAGGGRNDGAGFADAATNEAMADADSLRELQPQGGECEQRRRPSHGSAEMCNPDRQSLAVGQGQPSNARPKLQAIERADWWQSEPDVGRGTDGLATRLDRLAAPWEDGWEDGLPRIATGVQARVDRLKAIGNGQVPLCAATAWRLLTS